MGLHVSILMQQFGLAEHGKVKGLIPRYANNVSLTIYANVMTSTL
jgi:hypothetical protein